MAHSSGGIGCANRGGCFLPFWKAPQRRRFRGNSIRISVAVGGQLIRVGDVA